MPLKVSGYQCNKDSQKFLCQTLLDEIWKKDQTAVFFSSDVY